MEASFLSKTLKTQIGSKSKMLGYTTYYYGSRCGVELFMFGTPSSEKIGE